MNTLHIVSSKTDINLCVPILNDDDGLLILGNAITYLLEVDLNISNVYVLKKDMSIFDLRLDNKIQIIDYDRMVKLCCTYTKVNTWN